jgi:hypothetical protein
VYKILLESQVKEKPIAYTKWGKCLKKDRMHTLTCITQSLFFAFNYLELNKLKIFKWKLIHFILPCKELLKQWRIVNNSDCLVCKEKENYKHLYFDCKYNKKYWQKVKKMTTNLYIGDHVFNLESLAFGYKIYDQAYFDLNLLIITLIFFPIYKAYYISKEKQKNVDIFKKFKDEVNNVFDTNIFRHVKTGNFISKAHVYLNS